MAGDVQDGQAATREARGAKHRQPAHAMTWGDRFRWVFWRHLSFGGLTGGLVFLCLSLTPSLLPRVALLQGAMTGITTAIGYGLGSAASAGIRKLIRQEPGPVAKRLAWRILAGAAIVLIPLFGLLGRRWQEQVRVLMEMPSQASVQVGVVVLVASLVAYLLLVAARLIRALGRVLVGFLDRFLPRVVSVAGGVVATVVVMAGLVQGFVLNPLASALNSAFSTVNDGTSEGIERPSVDARSGSPDSVVGWDTLGVKGRDFIGGGPTVGDVEAFSGRQADQPIRVYVGLRSADTVAERVDLAMAELDRTGAWDRDVLAIFTTTGTGWVDAQAADPLEYMHAGSTALVALQYSYLPSWISFLVDQDEAAAAGRQMIDAVGERWSQLPERSRPELLLFGESLGSYGTESAFGDIDEMIAGVDGALLVGPVFQNEIHNSLTDERAPDSPAWRPVHDDGRNVRFAVAPDDLAQPATAWLPERIVYLQNSSDPITYFTPDLLWRRPVWLDDPRGPDVSPAMSWLPVITFWQVATDMAFSTGVPEGHGHVYGVNPVDAWVAISSPERWLDADTQRLRELIAAQNEE